MTATVAVEVFQFPETGQPLRSVHADGEANFVAADAATVLELGNVSSSLALLDDDEKGLHTVETPGGPQQMATVTEAGLYSLILRSRKPQAKAFKRWITHEVLPTIRKTGRYEVAPALPKSYSEALRELASTVEERDAAIGALAIAAPKADSFDAYQSAEGTHSFAEVAKMLHAESGLGRNLLMRRLRELKVLMPNNEPYQLYAHHFHVVAQWFEHADGTREVTNTTRVRATGVDFIRRKLSPSKEIAMRGNPHPQPSPSPGNPAPPPPPR